MPAGRGVRDAGSPGEDVGGGSGTLAGKLLGCHPRDGSDAEAGFRVHRGVGQPGDTEVDDLRPVPCHDDVPGFEVAVHHAGGMDDDQCLRQTDGEAHQRVAVQAATSAHGVGQAHPVHVCGCHPWTGSVDIGVEDFGHEGAANPPGGRDLLPKTRAELGIRGDVAVRDLDCHRLVIRSETLVDDPHPAFAETAVQAVRTNRTRIVSTKRREHPVPSRRPRSRAEITRPHRPHPHPGHKPVGNLASTRRIAV